MRATPGLVLLAVGIALAGCTDNTGAIDQEGHNGFDRMACTDFASVANDVEHGAMSAAQAKDAADKLAATSGHGGDPMVRQAGSDLAAAYRAHNVAAVTSAIAEFRSACKW